MLAKYRPSGRFGLLTLGLIPCLLVAVAVAAAIYQVALAVIPFVYLNFLIVAIGAGVVGGLTSFFVKEGHCRNTLLATAIGGLAGAVAVGVSHYVAYVIGTWGVSPPVSMADYMSFRVQNGWTLGRIGRSSGNPRPLNGWFVWTIWSVEALVLLIGGLAGGGFRAGGSAYCEACGIWLKPGKHELTLQGPDDTVAEYIKDATSVDQLLAPPLDRFGRADTELVLKVDVCPKCDQEAVLTVKFVRIQSDKKGNKSRNETNLHENVLLTQEELMRVRELVLGEPAGTAGDAVA